MSGSVTDLTSTAQAAQGAQGAAAAAGGAGNSFASLSDNFQTFLNLLLTQLKNQDPTAPTDTNQFTTELVQYSGVEQQIKTNSSLGSLISLTQGGQLLQGSAIAGKTVTIDGSNTVLSGGTAALHYTVPQAEAVALTIKDAGGKTVRTVTLGGDAGANAWTWDGSTDRGSKAPDGIYSVTALAASASGGPPLSVPVTETATVTGVAAGAKNTVTATVGTQPVPFSAILSVQ